VSHHRKIIYISSGVTHFKNFAATVWPISLHDSQGKKSHRVVLAPTFVPGQHGPHRFCANFAGLGEIFVGGAIFQDIWLFPERY